MSRRIIIIVDGPPASGKTTLKTILLAKIGGSSINYKAFGPANLIAKMVLRFASIAIPSSYDKTRHDPFLLLTPNFWSKLCIVIILLELLYKMLQQLVILALVLLKNVVIIDEFLVLRLANYINTLKHGIINANALALLCRQDIYFLKYVSTIAYVKYIYIEPSLSMLTKYWQKRGHKVPYNKGFLNLTKYSLKIVKRIVAKLDSRKISIKIVR